MPAVAPRLATGCISNQLKRLRENARKLSLAVSCPCIGAYRLSGSSSDLGSSVIWELKPARVARTASSMRGERRWLMIRVCAAPPETRSRAGFSAA